MADMSIYTQNSTEWSTPQDFFNELNVEFHFTLDVCATEENAKCDSYFTPEDNGLKKIWRGICWCNPSYGREVQNWIKKASDSAKSGATVVMLLFARTDTRWFHDYIYKKENVEIRFIKGRLKFGNSNNSAPFPSMVVVFRPIKRKK